MACDDIVGYLVREQRPFAEEPFNLIDALVLATLSYLKFGTHEDLRVTQSRCVSLRDVVTAVPREDLLRMGWMRESLHTDGFLAAVLDSVRYRDLQVCFYAEEHIDNVEKQFSAVTFLPGDGRAYLTYGGTDGTMVGWKENFNITFRDFTPAQLAGVSYASGVASALDERLAFIGHSKGGSHAQYAALCVSDEVFERTDLVVNFDGPSFLSDPSPRVDDPRFKEVFHKIVPEGSLFGLLLERRDEYRVIGAGAKLSRQHEPYSWLIDGSDFCHVENLRRRAKWMDATLSSWLSARTVEERELFIDTVYKVLLTTEARTIFDLRDHLSVNMRKVLRASKDLDPEMRRFVIETFKMLGSSAGREVRRANEQRRSAAKRRRRLRYTRVLEETASLRRDVGAGWSAAKNMGVRASEDAFSDEGLSDID